MSTQGKSLNQKSFAMASQGGGSLHIEMPPLDQTPTIQNAAPDPWSNQQTPNQQAQSKQPQLFQVPDHLPQDVSNEMAAQQYQSEQTQPIYEQQTEQPVEQPQIEEKPQDNFATLRIQKAKAERERDAMLTQILEMQNALKQQQLQKQQPELPQYQDKDFDVDDDSLVEGKVVKKMYQQQQDRLRQLESQMKNTAAQNQAAIVEQQLRSQYPDLQSVLSEQNIAIFADQYPELARSLNDTQNYYDKVSSVYKVIKQFGIYKNPVNEQERARVQANAIKPRPLSSVNPQQGDSPLARANAFANGMTDELKEQLRKEMYQARRNL